MELSGEDVGIGGLVVAFVVAVVASLAASTGAVSALDSGVSLSQAAIAFGLLVVGLVFGFAASFVVQLLQGREEIQLRIDIPPRSLGSVVSLSGTIVVAVGLALVLSVPLSALGLVVLFFFLFVIFFIITVLLVGIVAGAVLQGGQSKLEVGKEQLAVFRDAVDILNGVTDLDQLSDDEFRPSVVQAKQALWADSYDVQMPNDETLVLDISESNVVTASDVTEFEDSDFDVIARNLRKTVRKKWRYLTVDVNEENGTVTVSVDTEKTGGDLFTDEDA